MKKTTDICYNLSRRKRVRVVEGARLERVYTAMYRRFESSRFRQEVKKTRKGIFYFFEEEARIRAQGSHGAIAKKKGYHRSSTLSEQYFYSNLINLFLKYL